MQGERQHGKRKWEIKFKGVVTERAAKEVTFHDKAIGLSQEVLLRNILPGRDNQCWLCDGNQSGTREESPGMTEARRLLWVRAGNQEEKQVWLYR